MQIFPEEVVRRPLLSTKGGFGVSVYLLCAPIADIQFIHYSFNTLIIMAMKFKLVTRKNMGPDQEEVPEKIYAQMVCGDYVPFDEFVEEVADSSGVGSAG